MLQPSHKALSSAARPPAADTPQGTCQGTTLGRFLFLLGAGQGEFYEQRPNLSVEVTILIESGPRLGTHNPLH